MDTGLLQLGHSPQLAGQVGVTAASVGHSSPRFAYFADDQQFVVVAGAQQKSDVGLAFALGLTYRGDVV